MSRPAETYRGARRNLALRLQKVMWSSAYHYVNRRLGRVPQKIDPPPKIEPIKEPPSNAKPAWRRSIQ